MLETLKQWRLKSEGSRTYFFDLKETRELLQSLGAVQVETIANES